MFVKGYGFLSFAKNMSKKNENNLLQMHLKLLQKDQIKKHQKQLVI